jgi:hypothetical protein
MNLALRFFLELCMLGALGFWGARAGTTPALQWGLGLGAPLLAAVVWGVWVAPASSRRVKLPARLLVELVVFGAAIAALVAAEQPILAWIFGLLVLVNWVLMIVWQQ